MIKKVERLHQIFNNLKNINYMLIIKQKNEGNQKK